MVAESEDGARGFPFGGDAFSRPPDPWAGGADGPTEFAKPGGLGPTLDCRNPIDNLPRTIIRGAIGAGKTRKAASADPLTG